jgi:hypothetical protein
MHECKLPLNKCISPKFSSLDAILPLETRIGYYLSLLLVMHESSLQMQACASQIDIEHYNMLRRDIDKLDCHKFSTSIANEIDRDTLVC